MGYADTKAKDDGWRTALFVAAREGYILVVEQLLATKVDLKTMDDERRTPLSVATVGGYKDIYRYYSMLGVSIRIQETNKSDL